MTTIDFKLVEDLQLQLIDDLCSDEDLSPVEMLKFAKILVSNYKKAKRILKSKVEVDGDWESVLELTKNSLSSLIKSFVDLSYDTDLSGAFKVQFLGVMSEIQFLDYEDETKFKVEEISSLEDALDYSLYEDLLNGVKS